MKISKSSNRISIIGAGNVGAMLAQRILEHDLSNIVLVDIDEGAAKGKASDLQDAAPIIGYEKEIIGTSDYSLIKNSDIVVITAGFPRKPGMTREDLIKINGSIIKDVTLQIKEHAPESIIIVVTNPLDIMGYIAYKVSGFDSNKVIGMAGVLDSARCSNLAAQELGVRITEIDSIVIGTHDTNMLPLLRFSKAQGRIIYSILEEERRKKLIENVRGRGAKIVSLLKTGSAFFAPSAACFSMVKSILKNENITQCASVLHKGTYGINGIFIGAPVVLDRTGIKEIIQLDLSPDESEELKMSAEQLKKTIDSLNI